MLHPGDAEKTLLEQIEELKEVNRGRFDYVMARAKSPQPTIEEACNKAGRTRKWYYDMTPVEREHLERVAEQLHRAKTIHAYLILENAAEDAAAVKVDGLQSRDQRVKQQAATEILDRTIGKPGENVKITGNVGVTILWQPHKPES